MGTAQFITHCLCCCFLLMGKDSSHFSCAPVWGPSHGGQNSTNFSNVGSCHRLQFFSMWSSVGPSQGHSPSTIKTLACKHKDDYSNTGSLAFASKIIQIASLIWDIQELSGNSPGQSVGLSREVGPDDSQPYLFSDSVKYMMLYFSKFLNKKILYWEHKHNNFTTKLDICIQ